MDEIRIRELEVYAYHGVFPEENEKGQPFFVNATLYTDTRKAGQTDELEYSTHYGEVCYLINRIMKENTWKLIETVAEKVAEEILLTYPLVQKVQLEIRKPSAPIGLPFGSVSVAIERGWHKVYIAFGSNMGDKKQHIQNAIKGLKTHPHIMVQTVSDFIVTKPYGGVPQEEFLNGAMEIETLLSPVELLDFLHELEQRENRERTIHWGPRTLDLDILLYDNLVYEDEQLIIPHVDMQNRDFVLKPMAQIAPNMRHPIYKKTMQELCNRLDKIK
ncbi:MAG: 2-amino-4-hydroxy-6-hydroxymethyldihydropteridine diphosphokinase [Lachnospiraceae bacterium]|nr:2-amino-4-hydroxy-6-hydroxymethyldihydropteridine diphosphokinase [Lachnospiraceae bacterium]